MMVSFFFIRDGAGIVEYIKSVTPLSEDEKDMFFSRTKKLLNSVIFGILLTVAIQAVLGGIGWWFVGLGSPAFFGMLMFFFGMFPAGTSVVWIPGGIYLILSGDVKGGIILLVWGAAVVGTVDNLLRPFLISGGKGKDEEIYSGSSGESSSGGFWASFSVR
jgi:predicted PurR-regulated permease PerM